MDVLKSFYTTEIRLGQNEGDPVATIRWYPTKYDSKFPDAGTAFFSNVWETEVGEEYPQPGLGEIGLERDWAKANQPSGISGFTTYTPMDWFVNGPPGSAFDNLPIGSCGKPMAPKLLPAKLGFTFSTQETIGEQCLQLGLGFSFDFYSQGLYYLQAQLGLGFRFQPKLDGGYPIAASFGLGFSFDRGESYAFQAGLSVGAEYETVPSWAGPMPMEMESGVDFSGQVDSVANPMELGISFDFEFISTGFAYFNFGLEGGFVFDQGIGTFGFDAGLGFESDFYSEGFYYLQAQLGLGFSFTYSIS